MTSKRTALQLGQSASKHGIPAFDYFVRQKAEAEVNIPRLQSQIASKKAALATVTQEMTRLGLEQARKINKSEVKVDLNSFKNHINNTFVTEGQCGYAANAPR